MIIAGHGAARFTTKCKTVHKNAFHSSREDVNSNGRVADMMLKWDFYG